MGIIDNKLCREFSTRVDFRGKLALLSTLDAGSQIVRGQNPNLSRAKRSGPQAAA